MLPTLLTVLTVALTPPSSTLSPVIAEAIEIVREHFYDPEIVKEQWADVDSVLTQLAEHGLSDSQIINQLLGRLDTSHTNHYSPDEPAYYQLLDIYSKGALATQVNALFPDGISYVGIGAVTRQIDGSVFIMDIWPGGPAAAAGLLMGDEVLAADGAPFHPIVSFAEKENQDVVLTLRRSPHGEPMQVAVKPQRIFPADTFEVALRASARVHNRQGVQLGYIRPVSYAGTRYHNALIDELKNEPFQQAAGLVLDLRGGWGGASPEFVEVFLGGAPSLSIITPEGIEHIAHFRWRKPVVVLIDGGTRSGKELLAYAFKQAGVALVGTNSAGAVVGGRPFLLQDNTLLSVAAVDVRVDGHRLEGVGVAPTITIEFDRRYAGGNDPQLEAALSELHRIVIDSQSP